VTILLPLLAFVFASLVVAGAYMALSPTSSAIERRLGEVTGTPLKGAIDSFVYEKKVVDTLKRIGNIAPKSSGEMGKLQQNLVYAGYRGNEALPIFFGIRLGRT
jgi:hypothetical protein